MNELELKEAKRQLYHLLLNKSDLTDNEVDLMYSLSIDKQIQEIFDN